MDDPRWTLSTWMVLLVENGSPRIGRAGCNTINAMLSTSRQRICQSSLANRRSPKGRIDNRERADLANGASRLSLTLGDTTRNVPRETSLTLVYIFYGRLTRFSGRDQTCGEACAR